MSPSARRDVAYFDYRNFLFNYVPHRSHPTAKSIIDAMQFPFLFLNGKTPLAADRIGLSHLTLTLGVREA